MSVTENSESSKRPNSIDLRPCLILGVGEVFLVFRHPSASVTDWLLSHAFCIIITLLRDMVEHLLTMKKSVFTQLLSFPADFRKETSSIIKYLHSYLLQKRLKNPFALLQSVKLPLNHKTY